MSRQKAEQRLKEYGWTSSNDAFHEATEQIRKRKDGEITPLRSRWLRLDQQIGGGWQPSTIYTIGGRPGTGKSAFVNNWLLDICEENDIDNTVFCYWTWEMPAYQQLVRGFSGKIGKTVQELMSAETPLSDELYNHILQSREKWAAYPMWFMSYAASAEYIFKMMEDVQGKAPGVHIVNIFDHTRLARQSKDTYNEQAKITRLYQAAQQLSVRFGQTNVFLSQLNRDIESAERMKKPVPKLSDFFGADSVAQFSNVAMILVQPRQYRLEEYLGESTERLLALHVVKNRDGAVGGWIAFNHELYHNRIFDRYPIMETPTYSL